MNVKESCSIKEVKVPKNPLPLGMGVLTKDNNHFSEKRDTEIKQN